MKTPPINWDDLHAFGLPAGASITSTPGGCVVDPTPPRLVAKLLAAASASPPPEEPDAYCRHVRDLVLTATDWTQAADSPLTADQRAAWAIYRQALRDLPASFSGDGPIPWPACP